MTAEHFKAWLLERQGRGARLVQTRLHETDLDDGDVLLQVAYASVTRRDALACCAQDVAARRLPCIPGGDLVGRVLASAAPRFQPGDWVFASGYGIGFKHHGAYAERALLPGGWLLPVPDALDSLSAITLGASGLAVAMAVTQLEDNGLKPERGPVLVTGAAGSNGSLAVALLAARGYEVCALTSRSENSQWLKDLGAARVMLYGDLRLDAIQPLARGVWAGAVDNLGGNVLGWILASCKPGAAAVALGDVLGSVANLSLAPMVARGVSVLGVDSAQAGFAAKHTAWMRLAGDLHSDKLCLLHRVVGFEEVPLMCTQLLNGVSRGRTVVRVTDSGG